MTDASIQQMRHFVWVADLGSFHAAADRAHRSQPAISLSIRQLEHKLGQALFEDNRKAAQLTGYGELCLARMRQVVTHHDRTLDEIGAIGQRRAGSVSLAAVPSIATRLLPQLLPAFETRYPDIQLTLRDDNAPGVQALVTQGDADIGIASLHEADHRLAFQPVAEDPMGLVCRYDHPLIDGRPRSLAWEELHGVRLIGNFTARLLRATEAEPVVDAATHYTVSNMMSLLTLVRAGLGATVLPQLALPGDVDELCFCPLDKPLIRREIGLITRAGRQLMPAAAALQALIIEHMESEEGLAPSSTNTRPA